MYFAVLILPGNELKCGQKTTTNVSIIKWSNYSKLRQFCHYVCTLYRTQNYRANTIIGLHLATMLKIHHNTWAESTWIKGRALNQTGWKALECVGEWKWKGGEKGGWERPAAKEWVSSKGREEVGNEGETQSGREREGGSRIGGSGRRRSVGERR